MTAPSPVVDLVDVVAAARAADSKLTQWKTCATPGCTAETDRHDGLCGECFLAHRRREVVLREANMPPDALDFDSPDLAGRVVDASAITKARAWPGSGRLVICGATKETGLGRTTLAVCALKKFAGRSALFLASHELIAARFGARDDLVTRALNVETLLLDDVGREGGRVADKFRLIEHVATLRFNRSARTIFTTACTTKELEALYDAAFVRRMVERASIIVIARPGQARTTADSPGASVQR